MSTTTSSDQHRTLTTADLAASAERREKVQRLEEEDLQRDTPPRFSSARDPSDLSPE